MKRSDPLRVVDGGDLLPAVAADVSLFPAFPARSVFDVDRWVRTLELLLLVCPVDSSMNCSAAIVACAIAGIIVAMVMFCFSDKNARASLGCKAEKN